MPKTEHYPTYIGVDEREKWAIIAALRALQGLRDSGVDEDWIERLQHGRRRKALEHLSQAEIDDLCDRIVGSVRPAPCESGERLYNVWVEIEVLCCEEHEYTLDYETAEANKALHYNKIYRTRNREEAIMVANDTILAGDALSQR